jgi:hypothetical protein
VAARDAASAAMNEVPERLPAAPPPPKRTRKKGDAEDAAPPKPPVWRRYIGWAVIVPLAFAAIAEFRAQSSFKRHLQICQQGLERNEGTREQAAERITMDDLKPRFTTQPVHSTETLWEAPVDIYKWSWRGIRHYSLVVYANPKNGRIFDVKTEP